MPLPGNADDSLLSPLAEAEVLLFDFQATAGGPGTGHLLEAAWCSYRAADPLPEERNVASSMVRLPPDAALPPRVARVTGISESMVREAPTAGEVLARLRAAAGDRPLVAHYARFEAAFLPAGEEGGARICTHEIARRLLADLPRRGLRAVAGVLGHPTPELRRAAPHVVATAAVWRGLVELLGTRVGVTTLPALVDWLAATPVPPRGRRTWGLPREMRLDLPDRPGVYRFRGAAGEILYVGKATSLRTRVNSYFRRQKNLAERTLEMLTRARSIEPTPTATALEAALLEVDEIRRLAPPYNVALRGGEGEGPWWFDRAFASASKRRDRRHPVGPLGRVEEAMAVPALAKLLGGEGTSEDRAALWQVVAPWRAAQPEGRLRLEEGARELAARHGPFDGESGALAALLGLGRRLERERRRVDGDEEEPSLAPEEAAAEAAAEPSIAEEDGETPEEMADAFEAQLAHLSRSLRRGRWRLRLSSSRIDFADADRSRRRLELRGGVVVSAGPVEGGAVPLPSPPRPRPAGLDGVAWDRLRVLVTELRRVAAQGGEPSVELPGGRRVTATRFRAVLLGS